MKCIRRSQYCRTRNKLCAAIDRYAEEIGAVEAETLRDRCDRTDRHGDHASRNEGILRFFVYRRTACRLLVETDRQGMRSVSNEIARGIGQNSLIADRSRNLGNADTGKCKCNKYQTA